eukprot:gene10718-biopygen8512
MAIQAPPDIRPRPNRAQSGPSASPVKVARTGSATVPPGPQEACRVVFLFRCDPWTRPRTSSHVHTAAHGFSGWGAFGAAGAARRGPCGLGDGAVWPVPVAARAPFSAPARRASCVVHVLRVRGPHGGAGSMR